MIRKLHIQTNPKDHDRWQNLLHSEGIKGELAIEETLGYFDNDQLLATASRYQNVIKCVAVDSSVQGGKLFNEIISAIMAQITQQGYFKMTVYTKPESQKAFEFLGFKKIESVDDSLVFMEKAITGFSQFINKLSKRKIDGKIISAIVMNANPFTKGHAYLVEKASKESDVVHLFVLAEEMSAFSASVRRELVVLGTAHLDNVYIHSTENYMVSNATFPSYFLKEDDDVTTIQARLDARIFVHHIAPALNITRRYVGSEPLSNATNLYNEALKKEFNGLCELIIVERLTEKDHTISASKVRELLAKDNLDEARVYVPETTYQFFLTDEGKQVIEAIKEFQREHP